MNLEQLKKCVGYRIQLEPIACVLDEYGRELSTENHEWIVHDVSSAGVRISNVQTSHVTTLGADHIHHFTSNPDRSRGELKYGFLVLHVQVFLQGNTLWVRPNSRPGERTPPPMFFESTENRPLRIRRAFPASIVFNEVDHLPQVFFDMDSDIGHRLASKSSIARPYHNIDGKAILTVDVPITDGQKFLHGVDALQCKMLVDICHAQRGGSTQGWSANKGVIPTKITIPNTPEPTTKVPGITILDALTQNRFGQSDMTRFEFEYSQIPFPSGTSIRLESRPSHPDTGPEQRRVVVAIPGKATIVVSVEPLPAFGPGTLPQGASVPDGVLKYCRTFIYSVRVDAEIIRSGNHADVVQDYKTWIEWLASELQSKNED